MLSEVAKISGLSNGHFSFSLKQSTGIAPHAWLRRQRIDRAKTLLHDDQQGVADIAAAIVGFANQSAFGVRTSGADGSSASPAHFVRFLIEGD